MVSPLDISEDADAVVELYRRDVDLTLIRENLLRSHEERLLALQELLRFAEEVREAGARLRKAT
jgi:hypothetical protein